MEIDVRQVQGSVPVTILQTHGAIDGSNYRQLIERIRELFEGGTHNILLDLSQTEYMSSAGLVALQSIVQLLHGEEMPDLDDGWGALHAVGREPASGPRQHFKLLNPQPQVSKTLEMAGFTKYVEVFSDEKAAIAAFEAA